MSTIGSKFIVAITGLGLTLFVFFHMVGNLQVFFGPAVLNHYAHLLQSTPELLWVVRGGLLVFFVAHLGLSIRLRLQNRSARPVAYVHPPKQIKSTFSSQSMIWSGLAILFFLIYHLAHFTVGVTNPDHYKLHVDPQVAISDVKTAESLPTKIFSLETEKEASKEMILLDLEEKWGPLGSHDVYSMVIHGFRQPLITLAYVLAMVCLGLHMWHGVSSSFQTLGAMKPRWHTFLERFGKGLTAVVVIGNILIAVVILLGVAPVPPQPLS